MDCGPIILSGTTTFRALTRGGEDTERLVAELPDALYVLATHGAG